MNLIEELGGYEKAKVINSHMTRFSICFKSKKPCTKEELGCAMLEYRRKNEIYELGDLVVFKEEYSKDSVIHKIDSLRAGTKCLRHATDEEIEKGCRV